MGVARCYESDRRDAKPGQVLKYCMFRQSASVGSYLVWGARKQLGGAQAAQEQLLAEPGSSEARRYETSKRLKGLKRHLLGNTQGVEVFTTSCPVPGGCPMRGTVRPAGGFAATLVIRTRPLKNTR